MIVIICVVNITKLIIVYLIISMKKRNKNGQFINEKKLLNRNCKICNKEFKIYESRLKKGKLFGKFCSISCSLKGSKRRLGKKHTIETKIKISQNTPKYNGTKHWNWKGGISEKNRLIRQSLEYIIWRDEVWGRDSWTCRLCNLRSKGKSSQDIIAHHVKLFSEFPELRFSINNGITLCRKCHCKIHNPQKFHKL